MLNGERALTLRDKLIPAAEAGDFSEFTNESAIRASIAIQGSDQPVTADDSGSPLARKLAGGPVDDDARAYELVLPEVERVLTRTGDYEELWRDPWQQIEKAIESFEKRASHVEEFDQARFSLVVISSEVFGKDGFDPSQHAAPFTAVSRYSQGELFVIAIPYLDGWAYRLDYPYYSWAETIVRPRIERRNLKNAVSELGRIESDVRGKWTLDSSELSSAAKFTGADGKLACSSLRPEQVAAVISASAVLSEAAASH
jgi:hypothetical protein